MKITVTSRKKARNMSFNLKEKTAIISIRDVGTEVPRFHRGGDLLSVIALQFDDDLHGPFCIKTQDAEQIVRFVDHFQNKIDHLIIHCEAGVSRSAGVAVAICKAKGLDDSWIWDGTFSPNVTVALSVFRSFRVDEDEILFLTDFDRNWNKLVDITREQFEKED